MSRFTLVSVVGTVAVVAMLYLIFQTKEPEQLLQADFKNMNADNKGKQPKIAPNSNDLPRELVSNNKNTTKASNLYNNQYINELQSELQACLASNSEVFKLKREADNEIKNLLVGAPSLSSTHNILAVMAKNDVVSIPRAFYLMNSLNFLDTINRYREVEVRRGHRFDSRTQELIDEYKKLRTRQASNSPLSIKELNNLKGDLPETFIDFGEQKQTVSIDHFIAQSIKNISVEGLEKILKNNTLDQGVLIYAIEQGVSTYKLEMIAENITIEQHYLIDSNGSMTNPQKAAIELSNTNILQSVLSNASYRTFQFDTSGINHLVGLLLTEDSFEFSVERVKIAHLLTSRGDVLKLYQDPLTGIYSVLGHNAQATLNEHQVAYLQSFGIVIQLIDKDSLTEDISALENQVSVLAAIDSWKNKIEEIKELEYQCDKLQAQIDSMIPPFSDVKEAMKQYIDMDATFFENINRLSSVSPVLVDNYYTYAKFDRENFAIEQSKMIFLDVFASQFQNSSQTKYHDLFKESSFSPIEQTYIANTTCKSKGIDFLINRLDVFDSLLFDGNNNTDCIGDYENVEKFKDAYFNLENSKPSFVYWQISQRDFAGALYSLTLNYPTHGFSEGRDALALLLDQRLSSSRESSRIEVDLMISLVEKLNMEDKHFKRLNRLKFKEPSTFDRLLSANSEISSAHEFGFSRFR